MPLNDLFKSRAHPIRRVARELLALSFWVHACFIGHYVTFGPILRYISFSRYALNVATITFILYYSYLTQSGWLSVTWDLLFVYAYPFVLGRRILWRCSQAFFQYVKKNGVVRATNLILPSSAKVEENVTESIPEEKLKQGFAFWLRPFSQFSLLWSLLILTINDTLMLMVLCTISLIGAARALWSLQDLLADTSSWTGQLQSGFAKAVEQHIAKVRGWEEAQPPTEASTAANSLKVFEVAFGFIADNRVMLARCTWIAATLISMPFYLYISLLFANSYFGLAKLQHIQWAWSSSLMDSLYMPFAYTDLPKNWPIRLFAGLQGIAVTVLGWNIFTRHLSSRFDSLATAALELQTPLLDEALRNKITRLESLAKASGSPVAKEPAK